MSTLNGNTEQPKETVAFCGIPFTSLLISSSILSNKFRHVFLEHYKFAAATAIMCILLVFIPFISALFATYFRGVVVDKDSVRPAARMFAWAFGAIYLITTMSL